MATILYIRDASGTVQLATVQSLAGVADPNSVTDLRNDHLVGFLRLLSLPLAAEVFAIMAENAF